jgi:hypothetical protein
VRRVGLLAAGIVLVAGCGGSGAAPGKRLTKAELISRADAICTQTQRKNEELRTKAPAQSPVDPSASDETVRKSGPILQELSENVREVRHRFADLPPPKSVETRWEQTLDDLDTLADDLHDAAEAAAGADRQGVVNAYSTALRVNQRVAVFEKTYGFRVCGKS